MFIFLVTLCFTSVLPPLTFSHSFHPLPLITHHDSPEVVTVGKLDAQMLEEFISLWDIRDDDRAQAQSNSKRAQSTSRRSRAQAQSQSQSHSRSEEHKKQAAKKMNTTKKSLLDSSTIKGVIYNRSSQEGGSPSVEEKEKSTEYPEFQSFYRYDGDNDAGNNTGMSLNIVLPWVMSYQMPSNIPLYMHAAHYTQSITSY